MTRSTNPFVLGERSRASRWKRSTLDLPDIARASAEYVRGDGSVIDGPFDYCVPPTQANFTLLPEVREPALEVFSSLGIPWHDGIGGGPSNHLLDSQVQCVNALAPFMNDPEGIRWLLSGTLAIDEVLPIENDWYLTFEWIGLTDHLGEGRVSHEHEDR